MLAWGTGVAKQVDSRDVMAARPVRPADGLLGVKGFKEGKDWIPRKRRIGYEFVALCSRQYTDNI